MIRVNQKSVVAGLSVALCAFAVAAAVTAFPASEASAYPKKVRIWCKADYKRYCPRYSVGSARMRACMRAVAKNLSPVCKKALIESGLARRYGY